MTINSSATAVGIAILPLQTLMCNRPRASTVLLGPVVITPHLLQMDVLTARLVELAPVGILLYDNIVCHTNNIESVDKALYYMAIQVDPVY